MWPKGSQSIKDRDVMKIAVKSCIMPLTAQETSHEFINNAYQS